LNKKVLIITGDGVEAQEIFYIYYRLSELGYIVHVASPRKKDFLFTVVHDFEPGWTTYSEKPGYRFPWVHKSFKDADPEEYDGLAIPGGRAPEYIRLSPEIERIVKHFFDKHKPVAAICHGAQVLTPFGVLKGRRVTAYITVKPEVENAGAEYIDGEVVVDGNLVTSRAWPDLPSFMKEFIRLLEK
jgi:protease I